MSESMLRKHLSPCLHTYGMHHCLDSHTGISLRSKLNTRLTLKVHASLLLLLVFLVSSIRKIAAVLCAKMIQKQEIHFRNHRRTSILAWCFEYHQDRQLRVVQISARVSRLILAFFISIASIIPISGCSFLTKPSNPGPSPLVVASCPPLTPLQDDSFGAVTSKLVEVSGIYYGCRAAAGVK